MPALKQPLSDQALKLSAKKRMSLAVLLLESVEKSPEVDHALLATLQKRSTELRSGKVKGLSTEEAYGFSL